MISSWNLSDSKFPQVSRTLLSILGDINNGVIWMVSTRPFISKSSSPCANILVTVPSVRITIGITFIFMFYSFFCSLARYRHLSLFSLSFSFTLCSAGTANYTIRLVLFFITTSGRLAEIGWSVLSLLLLSLMSRHRHLLKNVEDDDDWMKMTCNRSRPCLRVM